MLIPLRYKIHKINMKIYYTFLFLCLQCGYMRAVFSNQLSENTYLLYNPQNTNLPKPEECTIILDAFSDHAANFTKCSIKHARPIRMCEKCIDHYVNFHKKYQELMNTVVNGTSCLSIYVSHDRLNVVTAYHDGILDMWKNGHCSDCFNWMQDKPVLSNNTITFYEKYNETMKCFHVNRHKAGNNTEQVCEKCMLNYIQLDEHYKSMSSDSIGVDSVCMDVVDSMNATRIIWSQGLNCCKLRRSPEIIFLCCTGIIAALPFLFYLAVRFCGPIRDLPRALKQSRFKQTILRSVNRDDQ